MRSKKWEGKQCSIKQCDRDVHCRGLCRTHYQYLCRGYDLLPITPIASTILVRISCSVPGCTEIQYAQKLCHTHYKRAHRGGRRCDVPGCKNQHQARGYCAAHYMIWMDNKLKFEVSCSESELIET